MGCKATTGCCVFNLHFMNSIVKSTISLHKVCLISMIQAKAVVTRIQVIKSAALFWPMPLRSIANYYRLRGLYIHGNISDASLFVPVCAPAREIEHILHSGTTQLSPTPAPTSQKHFSAVEFSFNIRP